MKIKNFEINGRVIEAQTREGLSNLKVEAWDKDVRYNDLIGVATTNADGGFQISFDSTYFSESEQEVAPDIFFKAYLGRKLLKSTEETPIVSAREKEDAVIEIDMPSIRTEGKDRVSAGQAFKAAAFFQQSDFSGVFREFRSKAGTSLGFLSDMVANTFSELDLQPLKVKGVREESVIGRDVDEARGKLEAQQVAVNEVRPYDPKANAASLKEIRSYPLTLRAGQRVNLYQENGKVRYYSIVREEEGKPSGQGGGDTEALRAQLDKVQEELNATRDVVAEKDTQIAQLQKELQAVRKGQDEMNKVLRSEAFAQLLEELQKKEPGKKPTGRGGGAKKPPK
ncbi:MAG: hypothetical protein H6558_21795 [Lewinellaceae bacterium]|nr:hypothetical protein [Lewinellaceae bacterium]